MTVVLKSRKDADIFASLNEEFFAQFNGQKQDSDFLGKLRANSFERALKTAAPSNRDEDFKYVNFRLLDFSDITPISSINLSNGNSGSVNTVTVGSADYSLPERFKANLDTTEPANSVVFGPISKIGTISHAELTHYFEFFKDSFPERKLVHLSHAFLSEAFCLHVAKGNEKTNPRQLYTRFSGAKSLASYATLVVVEENSYGALTWDIDAEADSSGLMNNTLDILVKSGSRFELLLNQELAEQINGVMTVRAYLEKDASIEIVTMNTGGKLNQMEIDILFGGKGTRALVNGIYIGRSEENFNLLTHQDHRNGNSISDLFYIGTLSNKSKSNYLGKITIAPNAQRSDAYQKNRNLVLTKGVSVNSSPKLEIGANDVRCTHGATTTRISDLEMFYLRSRGIGKSAAKILLADGFLEQVEERLKSPLLQQGYAKRLEHLLAHWDGQEA